MVVRAQPGVTISVEGTTVDEPFEPLPEWEGVVYIVSRGEHMRAVGISGVEIYALRGSFVHLVRGHGVVHWQQGSNIKFCAGMEPAKLKRVNATS